VREAAAREGSSDPGPNMTDALALVEKATVATEILPSRRAGGVKRQGGWT
jgi:hypothetical protein